MLDHRKQQTKQVFPLRWVFLADPGGCTKVPMVHWDLYPFLAKSLELGTPPLMCSPLYIPLILTTYATTYIINTSCPCHCAMVWWCHVLFGGKPIHMCQNAWVEISHSEHVCLVSMLNLLTVSEIPTPGAYHNIYLTWSYYTKIRNKHGSKHSHTITQNKQSRVWGHAMIEKRQKQVNINSRQRGGHGGHWQTKLPG